MAEDAMDILKQRAMELHLINSDWLCRQGWLPCDDREYDDLDHRWYESPRGPDRHSIRIRVNTRTPGHGSVYRIMRWGWFLVDKKLILDSKDLSRDRVLDLCRAFAISTDNTSN